MKRNIKRFTVKLTSALLLAATLMGTAATAVRADEMDAQPTECVETVVEGQGDVIDDQFAVSEEEAWEAANEIRTAEMAKYSGEFGTVEMDLHNAEWYQEYQKAQEAKAADVVETLFMPQEEYIPGFGPLVLQDKADELLKKAKAAKTPEEKAKYMKEYEETTTKQFVSYIPGGAAVYDLYKGFTRLFA